MSTNEETLDLVVGPPQLGGVHPKDGITLGTDLSVDHRATLVFLCAFSVLTRLSVIAADEGKLDTHCEMYMDVHGWFCGPQVSLSQ